MENLKNLEPLSNEQMDKITGGWKLFGWDYIYENQTMATTGDGDDPSGGYGSRYVMGIKVETGFNQTGWDEGTGVNSNIYQIKDV